MSNCNRIFMQPVTKSELICLTCGHVYDKNLPICTCTDKRNIVTWKQYVQHKIETGEYK
jgi:hypothetical protein